MKKFFTLIFILFFCAKAKSQSYILGYEYWCDTAYSSRTYVSITPQQNFTLDTLIGFSGVSRGLHQLNLRFQQTNFFWSQTVTEYFFKTGEGVSDTGKIKSYRYWVDGIDSVVTFHLSTPIKQFDLLTSIDLSWVHRGPNHLYIQFSDEADNWSVATVDSFYKSSIPTAAFTTYDTLVCGSDSIHFVNQSNDADVYLWDFGDGDTSVLENPVHYYQQGSYTVSLTATDTTGGNDSTLTIVNFVNINLVAQAAFTFTSNGPTVTFTNNSVNAVSYFWDFGDSTTSVLQNPVHTYPHDGNYIVMLTAFDSCGSAIDTQYVSLILKTGDENGDGSIDVTTLADKIRMTFNRSARQCSYTLLNSNGQVIMNKNLPEIIPPHIEYFDIGSLSAGVYFFSLHTSDLILTKKIFVGN